MTTAPGRTRLRCRDSVSLDAYHRPELEMHRCPAILLVLHLIFGIPRAYASAEQSRPAAAVEPDSVEVAWNEQEPALERSDRDFLPYAGKCVRRIWIKNLDVFGPSVDDAGRPAESRMERFLNHLNFQTREITIRRSLLFGEGDTIDPFRLAESERILRNLVFVGEARIVVVQAPESGDSADVLVIVKEAWTLELSVSPKEGNGLKAGLTEQNLFGLGHRISVTGRLIPDATPRLGWDTNYSVQNIHGSFITGKLEYVKMPGKESMGLALSRELISPVLRYAGGLDLRRTSIEEPESLPAAADNRSELVDFWAGRLVHEWRSEEETGLRRILFLSGRVRHLEFTERPPVTPSTLFPYHNTDHYLGSLTYLRSSYYRTNLLNNFGRTEDIPHGLLARVTYGVADEEFTRSQYASATVAAGKKIGALGYGIGELRIGGHPGGREIERGVIRLRTLYFSDLLRVGGFRFRQFVKTGYSTGIHRSADDSIDFDGDESIRGVIYDRSVTGSKRLQLDLESVAFTPWRVGGVTFALFTFADLDFIGSGQRSILAQQCYSGLGLGVRLHKDGFGIGPVQLRFAWYPKLPIDHAAFSYTAFAEERFRPIELLGGSPEIVEY